MPLFYVNPRYETELCQQGLRRVQDYLVCSDGVTVGRHASRHVRRLNFGEFQIFLKREHPVRWRDRFHSWLAGFGWVSKSRREWQVLRELRERNLPCPEPLAMGEIGNMAFLVVRGFSDALDLPNYLAHHPTDTERHQVLRNLGHAFADFHQAGFNHPDLYAKHVFVHRTTLQVSFVDFQRTCHGQTISWKQRCIEIARLDASLHPGAVPMKERLTFLHAYLHRAFGTYHRRQVRAAGVAIAAESRRLLRRHRVQAMYAETALLSGDVSVVTYCRVRVPEATTNRMNNTDQSQSLRGRNA
jgi:tRNA A-37 threonylcarbamoyl transferase component Bud32